MRRFGAQLQSTKNCNVGLTIAAIYFRDALPELTVRIERAIATISCRSFTRKGCKGGEIAFPGLAHLYSTTGIVNWVMSPCHEFYWQRLARQQAWQQQVAGAAEILDLARECEYLREHWLRELVVISDKISGRAHNFH